MPRILTESDVADFRERLCEAASRLFAARGREAFTMRELAAELGVSAMTPYRYFRDKDEILAAVRARAFMRFAESLEAAIATQGDAQAKAAAVYESYVDFAFGEPQSYRLMFDLSQPHEDEYPELVEATTRARATMTDYVRALVDAGVLEGDPDLMGYVFWSSLHGAVVLQLAGKLDPKYDFRTITLESFRALSQSYRKDLKRALVSG
jgi:AcrR family transcriptional regulator